MAFDNIRLDKGLYTTGKSFTAALEAMDPSDNYIGTPLEGLDAYQRQLKRFDIKVSGRDSDCIAKFFKTTDSATLFPEFVSRAVRQGIERDNPLEKIVAATTEIDSFDYRAVELHTDKEAAIIGEGAFIPETTITLKETLTPLKKRGRMLVSSYEAIKFQKLDLFSVVLAQIGASIVSEQFKDAVLTLTGDDVELPEGATGVTYEALLELWDAFEDCRMTTMIADSQQLKNILSFSEFRDAAAGLDFHGTGKMVTPFGADIIRVNGVDFGDYIIGFDKRYALEMVQAGGIMTDFDKLIDRQMERATVTSIAGFSLINEDAVKMLKTTP